MLFRSDMMLKSVEKGFWFDFVGSRISIFVSLINWQLGMVVGWQLFCIRRRQINQNGNLGKTIDWSYSALKFGYRSQKELNGLKECPLLARPVKIDGANGV